jgi:tRNA-2-methylthio-N6-dimethylallyladenosine synthase
VGQKTTILFEELVKGRWKGRTPTNKLVFATSHPGGCSDTSQENLRGQERPVEITWTGPWSMQGRLV